MSRRIATLLAPTDVGVAGTKTVDIDLDGQISRIAIRFRYTVVTVSVMLDDIMACLSKIEVVDGSDAKFSTTGKCAQGINFLELGAMPYVELGLTVGNTPEATVYLDFGRWLWDPNYALRTATMKNPQLKIQHNEAAANTSAVVNSMAVYAYVDDSPSGGGANGYIQTREIKSFGFNGANHEYAEMPLNNPLRRCYLQALSTDHDTITLLDTLKMNINGGSRVPFDINAEDYIHMIMAQYGPVILNVTLDAVVTAKTLYVPTSQQNQIAIQYDDTDFVTAQSHFAVLTNTGQKMALAASVDIQADTGIVSGFLPQGLIPFDFGDPKAPETWLNPSGLTKVELDILGTSDADSGDTGIVVVQEAVMY